MTTNQNSNPQNKQVDKKQRVLTIVGIVLCVILVPMLIVNCTLIVKSLINKDEVPDFAGVVPLIVLTDSMYPDIKRGDLIFTKVVDANNLEEGDVISFYAAEDNYTTIWTHKIIEVIKEGDTVKYRTQGVNNPTPDGKLREVDKIIGKYADFRIGGAGNVAMAMQKPGGLIVCVVVPILLFVGYDILRRKLFEKNQTSDVDALRAELEALKAEKAMAAAQAPVEVPVETPVEVAPEVIPEVAPEIAPQEDTTPEPPQGE
jgi:signal peptidase